jgi:hypothetical protein
MTKVRVSFDYDEAERAMWDIMARDPMPSESVRTVSGGAFEMNRRRH